MEAIFLDCGAGGPQLKRNPLGSMRVPYRFLAVLSFVACCRPPATAQVPAPGNGYPFGGWQWDGRPQFTHVLVLVIEQSTGRLRYAATVYGGLPACTKAPIADSTFLARGIAFLRAVGWSSLYPGQQRARRFAREFVRVDAYAGDPSAFVIFHQDGGLVYAGSSMWMGHGERYYPSLNVDPWDLQLTDSLASPPDSQWSSPTLPDSLQTLVRRLNVVRALSSKPYSLTAFIHNKEGQPWLLDADWIVLLARQGKCP